MLGDWRPSTLCIWLRCREALESVMKKALGGIWAEVGMVCVCVCVGRGMWSAGRGWWVSIKGGRGWRKVVQWLTAQGVSDRRHRHFFLLSLLFCLHLIFNFFFFCCPAELKGTWLSSLLVCFSSWMVNGALRAQQEHSIQFTGLSHMAPGAARGTLPWWSAPAAHKLCRGNKRTGQTVLRRSPALHFSLRLFLHRPQHSTPHF